MKTTFKKRYLFIIAALTYFALCLPNQLFDDPLCIVVNDKDGNLINARIAEDGQWRFPVSDSVPQRFEKCLVHFEDKRFYKHMGIDLFAIGEAAKVNLKCGTIKRGGSTLTMQLMRLSRKKSKRNFLNKATEMIMALRYELSHTKTEIMLQYAAHAPFGSNVVGIDAASWRYFGKNATQLSWAESALLAVLPNAPSLIHLNKNRDLLLKKRNKLLFNMQKEGIITEEEYQLSLLESIPPAPVDLPSLAPHLLASLPKIDNNKRRFKSTIDRSVQTLAQQVLDFHHTKYVQEGIDNGALLVMDTQTGEVLAYIGNTYSPNEKYVDMVMAQRSSGSLLKPILFAAMQDASQLTPRQLMVDIPINLNGFAPQNFDKSYKGAAHADDALAQSLNIPFVLELKEYGTQKFIHTLHKLNIKSINKPDSHYGLTLILGGAEVNLWEMCGAYASMGRTLQNFTHNGSKYDNADVHLPSIEHKNTKVKNLTFEPPVLSAGAIYTTLEALSKLQRPDEEGNWQYFNSTSKIAWKTGTSFGHKDAWAIGVTPKYTVGVWIGNASGEGRAGLTGASKAAPVLFDVFNRLPYAAWFDTPWDDLQKVPICKQSGYIASPICDEIDTMYIAASGRNHEVCPFHKNIYTNLVQTYRVLQECCHCEGVLTPWFELPPALAYYFKDHHAEYKNLPPFIQECAEYNTTSPKQIDIIYPAPNAKIFIPKNMDEKKENVIAKATSTYDNRSLFWHLDDHYIGITNGLHSLALNGTIGKHKLTITDESGHRVVRNFEIIN
jgi:penicillin-binding protein 1C